MVTVTAPNSRVVSRSEGVRLTWEPEYPQTAYEILYRRKGAEAWDTFGRVEGGEHQANLDAAQFEDFQEYHYRVVCYAGEAEDGAAIYDGNDSSAAYSLIVVPANRAAAMRISHGDKMVEVPIYDEAEGVKIALPSGASGAIPLGEAGHALASGLRVNVDGAVKEALGSEGHFAASGVEAEAYMAVKHQYSYSYTKPTYGYTYQYSWTNPTYYYKYKYSQTSAVYSYKKKYSYTTPTYSYKYQYGYTTPVGYTKYSYEYEARTYYYYYSKFYSDKYTYLGADQYDVNEPVLRYYHYYGIGDVGGSASKIGYYYNYFQTYYYDLHRTYYGYRNVSQQAIDYAYKYGYNKYGGEAAYGYNYGTGGGETAYGYQDAQGGGVTSYGYGYRRGGGGTSYGYGYESGGGGAGTGYGYLTEYRYH